MKLELERFTYKEFMKVKDVTLSEGGQLYFFEMTVDEGKDRSNMIILSPSEVQQLKDFLKEV